MHNSLVGCRGDYREKKQGSAWRALVLLVEGLEVEVEVEQLEVEQVREVVEASLSELPQ